MKDGNTPLIVILGAAHSLNHSFFLILPPLLSIVVMDFNSNFEEIGIIATFSLLIYGLGAIVGGPLSDRLGSIKVIQIGAFIAGISTLIILVSKSLLIFTLGMLLIAFGSSFYHPTANRLITTLYRKKMAQVMGIHGSIGSLGQMLTPTIAFTLGVSFGWRIAFVFFGSLSIIVGLSLMNFRFKESVKRIEAKRIFDLFKDRRILLLLFYFILAGLHTQGVLFFFPSFLSLERGIAPNVAAYSYSALLLMGVIGQLLCGRASDKYGSIKLVITTNIGVLFGLIALLWIPFTWVAVIVFIIIYGTSIFGNQPPITSLVGKVSPKESVGLVFGITFSIGFGLGSISTTMSGYIADHFNLSYSYYSMVIIVLSSVLASLFLPSEKSSS